MFHRVTIKNFLVISLRLTYVSQNFYPYSKKNKSRNQLNAKNFAGIFLTKTKPQFDARIDNKQEHPSARKID